MACQQIISTRAPYMTLNCGRVPPLKSVPGQFKVSLTGKLPLVLCFALLLFVAMCFTSFGFQISQGFMAKRDVLQGGNDDGQQRRYLYWGPGIDCPGKHCIQCGGLGHQESSLRCALEEAMFLNRTFVLPSRMCIANKHANTRLLQHSDEQGLELRGCSMDMLYNLTLMSHTVRVILSNSKEWQATLERKDVTFVEVEGIKTEELKRNSMFQQARIVHRTANKLAWFMECKNRHNRSAISLPYSFLPSMAARPLLAAADLIKRTLKEYDALHVRRGDKVRVHMDKAGAICSMYAHLDRDTQPKAIMDRIKLWIPAGRTLYIATNEKQIHYFDQLSSKYRVLKAENFSAILDPVVHNNYQLFIVERLVVLGARTLVKTWKEDAGDLSLSDEAKKNPHRWGHAVTSR